ncbi:hypothetical protein EG328_008730 [Venturia inaequalis]|uniref:RING-type domain-containing protein n=1 Tax=Venturia inaequalis TaxID=5025 RepID=A0A8H3ZDE0_VENIN|nr:hypothetical protein EG328_008730 [Venturia inaequalis]KAE9989187.1 hypothetical protein EG327_003098 [Venturia inaequalis]
MPILSRSTSRPMLPTLSDSAWAAELINRLSSILQSQQTRRTKHAHSKHLPHFHIPSIPGILPSNTAPPNSPASAKNPTDRESNRQHKLSSAVTANKIKVLVTVEVITETEEIIYRQPETQSESSTSNQIRRLGPKQRPRTEVRQRSPSPKPIRPCPITHVPRRAVLGEDCSICSTSLVSATTGDLVWCKGVCGNNFHKSCFDEWRLYAARPLRCVHCRSVWRRSCQHDDEKAEDPDIRSHTTNVKQSRRFNLQAHTPSSL